MKYIGYCEKLPLCSGDKVTIKKGTPVTRKGEIKPARRTFTITIHHMLNGYMPAASERLSRELNGMEPIEGWNPRVVWAGKGGYWCEADINDITEAFA